MTTEAGGAMTREQLAKAANRATECAERDAADIYPEGPDRDRKFEELRQRYYAQYVTPPITDPWVALATERAAREAVERDLETSVALRRHYSVRNEELSRELHHLKTNSGEMVDALHRELSALRSRCEGLVAAFRVVHGGETEMAFMPTAEINDLRELLGETTRRDDPPA